jgi:hypothetical protein
LTRASITFIKVTSNNRSKPGLVGLHSRQPSWWHAVCGVTNDLIRRAFEHREGLVRGFTKRYGIKMLVYCEQHETAASAIQREKNFKHWPREWKIET